MSDYIYRFEGIKIRDGWQHPLKKELVISRVKWLDSQSDEQLAALKITKHPKPHVPKYDPYYQKPVEQPSGDYVIEDMPLADVKAKKKAELNAIREQKKRGGFMYQNKLIQSDENSFFNIETAHGAALAAKMLGQPFSTEWTTADNSKIQMDADGMLAMHADLTAMGQECHTVCQQLKAQVDACKTGAQVKAVEWPA